MFDSRTLTVNPGKATMTELELARLPAHRVMRSDDDARAELRATRPANTARTYNTGWNQWERFCTLHGLPLHEARFATLLAYIEWMAERGAARSTIETGLYGILYNLKVDYGVTVSKEDRADLVTALSRFEQNIARTEDTARGRGQADAVTLTDLITICNMLPENLQGQRDRVLVLLLFRTAARGEEAAQLPITDTTDLGNALKVHLRYTKTKKPRTLTIPTGVNPKTCLVSSWRAYREGLQHAGADTTAGKALRGIDKWGKPRATMSPKTIRDNLARLEREAGLSIHLTGHGFRAGMATEARRRGASVEWIARQGGWTENSREMWRYIRSVDQAKDDPFVDAL